MSWQAPRPLPLTIDTPRLTLRLTRLDEIPACCKIVGENIDHLLPWMPWAKFGEAGAAKHYADQLLIAGSTAPFREIALGIFRRDTGAFIGGTGIHDTRSDSASAETGYWIAKAQTGNGYAEEACRHVISWALRPQAQSGMGLHRIRIFCSSANVPSQRIPEKLGLTAELRQRDDYPVDTIGLTDRLGWGVLANEWDCESHEIIG